MAVRVIVELCGVWEEEVKLEEAEAKGPPRSSGDPKFTIYNLKL